MHYGRYFENILALRGIETISLTFNYNFFFFENILALRGIETHRNDIAVLLATMAFENILALRGIETYNPYQFLYHFFLWEHIGLKRYWNVPFIGNSPYIYFLWEHIGLKRYWNTLTSFILLIFFYLWEHIGLKRYWNALEKVPPASLLNSFENILALRGIETAYLARLNTAVLGCFENILALRGIETLSYDPNFWILALWEHIGLKRYWNKHHELSNRTSPYNFENILALRGIETHPLPSGDKV